MIALLLLLGCQKAIECGDHGDCENLDACIDGECTAVGCLSSKQCAIGNHCDKATFSCQGGCETNDDCYAGEWCPAATHECTERACQSTQLDCSLGEVCEQSGECVEDPGPNCWTCGSQGCGVNGTCFSFSEFGGQYYCLQRCENDEVNDCPQGYDCSDFGEGQFYCFAWCPALDALGYLD